MDFSVPCLQGIVNELQQQVAARHAEAQQLGRQAEQLQQEGRQILRQNMTAKHHYTQLQVR
jgi:F0F1-type ATP synthase membrane subunit b/b'